MKGLFNMTKLSHQDFSEGEMTHTQSCIVMQRLVENVCVHNVCVFLYYMQEWKETFKFIPAEDFRNQWILAQ